MIKKERDRKNKKTILRERENKGVKSERDIYFEKKKKGEGQRKRE